ncbi:unnamed protein product [Orchesella dallaii]|uniref:C2H2-type domain-containing protein n=1 Tax=Orchesella dallaii TaxID=48710 RepID=A0ABP1QB85_9HEXA
MAEMASNAEINSLDSISTSTASETAGPVSLDVPCDKKDEDEGWTGWTFTIRDPKDWVNLKDPNFYKQKQIIPAAATAQKDETENEPSEMAVMMKEIATKMNTLVEVMVIQQKQEGQSNVNAHSIFKKDPANRKPEDSTLPQSRSAPGDRSTQQPQPYPLQCSVCNKQCKTFLGLKAHERMHRERTLMCDRCPKMFKSQDTLNRHFANKHFVAAYSRFICESCFKRFGTYQSLLMHTRLRQECRRLVGMPNRECSSCTNSSCPCCLQRSSLTRTNLNSATSVNDGVVAIQTADADATVLWSCGDELNRIIINSL